MGKEEKACQNAYVLESEQNEEKRGKGKSAGGLDPTTYVSKHTILTYICSRVESPIPQDTSAMMESAAAAQPQHRRKRQLGSQH